MNDATQNKKDSVLKSLAVAGFIGIIVLIAWLSIQLVNVLPGAFSSLASLAEGINQGQRLNTNDTSDATENPLLVSSDNTLISAGDSVNISWGKTETQGSFTFSYKCREGVAVDITNIEGIRNIACDTNYNVGDVNSLTLTIDSEKDRYSDVEYTVSFLATNDTTPRNSGSASITVVNSERKSVFATDDNGDASTKTEFETEEETDTETTTDTVATVATKPSKPTYEQKFIYTIPVSDPNGRTDLSTKFLNLGTIKSGAFYTGPIKQNSNGAIQFEVINLGSKTSKEWDFKVTLPDGSTYSSEKQKPLKPNERAVLAVGFSTNKDP
ncbi:hypothetical protein KC865_04465, partial [Candidatus Kaiserbacteria bacterium]|nr:hypothetical protein [Candidatus Kaiserbacteria bacterium]